MYYDPPGRATKVKLPNGCLRRVLFDAWKQEFWDENDCAADSDCTADSGLTAWAADHTETPTKIHLDHLGRPIATEEYAEQEGDAIWTVLTLDVAGNPTAITDARSIATQAQVFDLLGRPIHSSSPDAGDSTVFLDVAGQPLRIWKAGDLQIDFGYDDLRRKTKTLVTEGASTPRLVEVNEYGESEGTTLNHRGRLWRQWDTAGRVEVDAYDFKGNPLSSTRRFWDWEAEGEQVTWGESLTDTPSDSLLEAEEFTVEQSFDALNRPTTQTTPDGSITEIGYNQAALFESVGVKLRGSATLTPFVVETTYNARGQREQIDYGNGVSTSYSYDANTFQLNTLESWREGDGLRYQKLAFTYDPVGNIVGIEDTADSTNHTGLATTLYFANGAVTADQDFTYDALYRLTVADGREKTALAYVSPGDEPAFGNRPDLSTAVQRYTQSYSYDGVGNILEMDHFVGGGSAYNWTREYSYAGDSNRLEETTVGAVTDTFAYDDRGSIVYLPNLKFSGSLAANIETDFRDQIRKAHLATSGHYALYFYDAAGQRARKVVVKGTTTTERIYVGGVWERYREYDGSGDVEEETETLHVMDGAQRVAMVETKTVEGGSALSTPDSVQRYQLGNHLGTVAAELDEDGEVISYEEYHPYGTTAWQAPELSTVSQKRYRYTGIERDEESGLQCHGVRYYVVWLGRWGSCDPIGVGDGVNRYQYVHCCPSTKNDPSGLGDPVPMPNAEEIPATASTDALTGYFKNDLAKAVIRQYMANTDPNLVVQLSEGQTEGMHLVPIGPEKLLNMAYSNRPMDSEAEIVDVHISDSVLGIARVAGTLGPFRGGLDGTMTVEPDGSFRFKGTMHVNELIDYEPEGHVGTVKLMLEAAQPFLAGGTPYHMISPEIPISMSYRPEDGWEISSGSSMIDSSLGTHRVDLPKAWSQIEAVMDNSSNTIDGAWGRAAITIGTGAIAGFGAGFGLGAFVTKNPKVAFAVGMLLSVPGAIGGAYFGGYLFENLVDR